MLTLPNLELLIQVNKRAAKELVLKGSDPINSTLLIHTQKPIELISKGLAIRLVECSRPSGIDSTGA